MSGLAGLLVKGLKKQLVKKAKIPSASASKKSKNLDEIKNIKLNKTEAEILESSPNSLKNLFDKDIDYVVDTFENFGIYTSLKKNPTKIKKGTTDNFKNKIYLQTQESLKDLPDKITVYRQGKLDPGINVNKNEPLSFTLSPFRGELPGGKRADLKNFEAYEVNKKDILANYEKIVPNYSKRGTSNEREILIFPENVKLIKGFFKGGMITRNPYGSNYQKAI